MVSLIHQQYAQQATFKEEIGRMVSAVPSASQADASLAPKFINIALVLAVFIFHSTFGLSYTWQKDNSFPQQIGTRRIDFCKRQCAWRRQHVVPV
jgi:hypothetical protein